MSAIDQDKGGLAMQRVRHIGIHRMRVVFNKLSATAESQAAAAASLLEMLLCASRDSPALLRYTLVKVSASVVADCQEEFFSETDEGHPTKLARVSCALCAEISDLAVMISAQFSLACPLVVPRGASDPKLQGEDFLEDMCFRRKKTSVSHIASVTVEMY